MARLKYSKGFEAGQEDVEPGYIVQDLREALQCVHSSDAHLVTYLVDGLDKQPRINKAGLKLYGKRLTVECFFCDVDNPGHAPWNDEWFAAARQLDTTLPILSTAGVYYTKHGRRFVQPLAEPLEIADVEPNLLFWLVRLSDAGLNVDWGCKDWTRHYRLPYVRRDCANEMPRVFDLTHMRAVALPRLPPVPLELLLPAEAKTKSQKAQGTRQANPRQPRAAPRAVPPTLPRLPDRWQPLARRVAAAVAEVRTEWHTLFMVLAGALLSSGVPYELVPALNQAISELTGLDERRADRRASALSTIAKKRSNVPVRGFASLRKDWPEVAEALTSAIEELRATELPRVVVAEPPVTRSLEETLTALEAAIENAPAGLTVIKAECGLGKTQAALRIAARRAAKPYASPKAAGLRAPANSKTAISVDKNALARQCANSLARLGSPGLRLFGPLSMRDAAGEPVCRYHQVAEPLVAGGQRMQWELCERRNGESKCPHYDTCPARSGQEGPSNSRVTIGTHALLGALDGEAGSTGLLVIDEVQDFLETTTLTEADFALTLQSALTHFDGVFVGAMLPAVWALNAFLQQGVEDQSVEACQAVQRHEHAVPLAVRLQGCRSALLNADADAVECAINAPFPDGHRGHAPPIMKLSVDHALAYPDKAPQLGSMSTVLRTVHHAVSTKYPVVARVERQGRERVLRVTAPREMLARSLRRDGAVVVTDANADLHLPVLSKVVGYVPPYHVFTAPDGAPIERTWLRTRKANRKAWFKNGRLDPLSSLPELVHAAMSWAREDANARVLGFITVPLVEIALRYAAGIEVEQCRATWKALGQPRKALEALSVALGPTVALWPGTILTAHYGATRGLDDMAGTDALVTLGDPWANLNAARADARFLNCEDDWEERYRARCQAELEQAQGRLRTVHRTRPGRALHVGNVMPGGSGWTNGRVEVRDLSQRKQAAPPAMSAEHFAASVHALGGVRAAARILGCSKTSIDNYSTGKRVIPVGLVARLDETS